MYSSTNGRYVKMSLDQTSLFASSSRIKLSKEEKRCRKTKYLLERAFNSKDPGLYEVCTFIEKCLPHYIQYVNEDVYIPSEFHTREMDIIGKTAIIEIKMGHRGNKIKQLLAQKEIADKRKLKMIVYCPYMPFNAQKEFRKREIIVTTNKKELYQEIKQ